MSTHTTLPPAHEDTAQQKLSLRRNRAAKANRLKFPRGTRVEATAGIDSPSNGNLGTVVDTIPGHTALGGVIRVLWDGRREPSTMLATGLRVVAPVQRVAARDVRPGDLIEGRAVAYNTTSATARAQRLIKFTDGGCWIAHHAEKIVLVRPEGQFDNGL